MAKLLNQKDGLIIFNIKINGKPIPDTVEVQEIMLDMEVNKISNATIIIQDGGAIGVESESFTNSEGDLFVPGNEIEISLGYDSISDVAFKGVITAQRLTVKNNSSTLSIICKDSTFRTTQGRFNTIFKDHKESKIIKTIVSKYSGLKVKIEESSVTVPLIMQYNATDWDFMVMRAAVNNMIVTTYQNKIDFKTIDFSKDADVEINTADFVQAIDLKLNGEYIVSDVQLNAWNSQEQKKTIARIKMSDTLRQGNLSTTDVSKKMNSQPRIINASGPLTREEMQLWGKSLASKMVIAKIEGTITIPGTIEILAGAIIKLSGFSTRFNGKAFITRVVHLLEEGEWFTTLYVGAPPQLLTTTADVVEAPASVNLIPCDAPQIALVEKIHDDPTNENRVLIALPSFKGTGQEYSIWARVSVPYASNDADFFFFPEVGDEVLITFLNNDRRYPVIVGALYNDQHIPKETPNEKNRFKTISSRSGIQIRFDDEEKIVTIETPEKNTIILSDMDKSISIKDINDNSFVMDMDGIVMKSPKDISIAASGNINMVAKGKIAFKANADLTGEGKNVTLNANIGFTAKGTSSAEISASGQTTIKGAMVMIN